MRDDQDNQVFMSLAPRSDGKYAQSYTDGLDFAFTEPSIWNIGIVGPYASGKTTVVRSYESAKQQEYASKRQQDASKQQRDTSKKQQYVPKKLQYVYITLGDYVRSAEYKTQEQNGEQADAPKQNGTEGAPKQNGTEGAPKQNGTEGATSGKSIKAVSSTSDNTPKQSSTLDSLKANREIIADLQNRIIEQLLCYESPYGSWRSSITRFWRGANAHLISLMRIVGTAVLIVSLFTALDLFDIVTNLRTFAEDRYVAEEIRNAEEEVLGDTSLEEFLRATNEHEANQRTNQEAEDQSMSQEDIEALRILNSTQAEIDTERELNEMATAAGAQAAIDARNEHKYDTMYIIIRTIGCTIVLVGAGLLVSSAINAGVTVNSLTLGPSSVDVNKPSLPFQSQIDNVIYLFRRTERTVFVFEDLDRMDKKAEILTALRELNYELNTYEQTLRKSRMRRVLVWIESKIGKEPRVYKFVYCIQAGCIPDAEERSKFFDFIVPIVPHGDASSFGDLLDAHLGRKPEYKPDADLLDQAGQVIIGMRMYENLVNEYMVYRKVLNQTDASQTMTNEMVAGNTDPDHQRDDKSSTAGNNGSATPVNVILNNLIFAIVAYKNICPLDYAQFERHTGFLNEMLTIESKRAILTRIADELDAKEPKIDELTYQEMTDEELVAIEDKAKNSKDERRKAVGRDSHLPYVAIYEKYGKLAAWDSALLEVMRDTAGKYGYEDNWRDALFYFVQYCLEHGHIREDVRNYATLSHKQMREDDRAFCTYVRAKHWNKTLGQQGVSEVAQSINNPKAVVQTLHSCAFANNERALNKTLLNYLINQVDLTRELRRYEEDPLFELLYTMFSDKGARFFCEYLCSSSTAEMKRFYDVVTSQRYMKHRESYIHFPSYKTVANNVKTDDPNSVRLAAVSLLRLVYQAPEEALLALKREQLFADLDKLRDSIRSDNGFATVWHDEWDSISQATNPGEKDSSTLNPVANEIAVSLQKLKCGVQDLSAKGAQDKLLAALIEYRAYVVNWCNIDWMLKREGHEAKASQALTAIRDIEDQDSHLKLHLDDDPSPFVSVVVNEASKNQDVVRDSLDTVYWVLNSESLDLKLRKEYVRLCERDNLGLVLSRIRNHGLWKDALNAAAFSQRNARDYIMFQNVKHDAFYYYIMDYALFYRAYPNDAEPLNEPMFRNAANVLIEKAVNQAETESLIRSMRDLFGIHDDKAIETIRKEIERRRSQCIALNSYTPLGKYIAGNIEAYEELLRDDTFRLAVHTPSEITSAITASASCNSLQIALMFAKSFPVYASACMRTLAKRIDRLPNPERYKQLRAYCTEMGYNSLSELFLGGNHPVHLASKTDEWMMARDLAEDGVIVMESDGSVSLPR